MTGKIKSLPRHEPRKKKRQVVGRLEVNVRKEDASPIRLVASALSDPSYQVEARKLLQQDFVKPPKVSPKALLASATLYGIDLDRSRDVDRDIELRS